MSILQIMAAEFRRLLATPMSRLALAALTIVPLLYGGVYLWANQDPYAKLSSIPVALVVEDEGARDDTGQFQNIGKQVGDKLMESGTFDWHRATPAEADRGVKNEIFDFSVTLPKDFTKQLLTVSTSKPVPGRVQIITNDANSYLATTIGGQAAKKIQASITQLVNENAALRILTGLAQVRDGMGQASTGAKQLADGSTQLKTGAGALHEGLGKLDQGVNQLQTGTNKLYDGAAKLHDGATKLHDGATKLADGAGQVAAGDEKIAELGNKLYGYATEGRQIADSIGDRILRHLQDHGVSDLIIEEVQAIENNARADLDKVDAKISGANDQLQKLAAGAKKVADGAKQLADGTGQIQTGTSQIMQGVTQLQAGAGELKNGSGKLYDGSKKLLDGSTKLDDGTKLLASKLAQGITKLPATTASEREAQAKGISDPVHLDMRAVASAGSYGAGIAPFFLSLASWIGMYALMLIMKPVSKRAITALHAPVRVGLAGWLIPSSLGLLQAGMLYAIVSLVLDFNIVHGWGTLFFMMLICGTFAAIIVALNVWLASVGQFLGLVLMVLQLVTAGGTFPWQTLPGPLAQLHHWLPMSYAVDGLRQLMYGGSMAAAKYDTFFLLLVLLVSVAIIILGVARQQNHRTIRDLQPSLIS